MAHWISSDNKEQEQELIDAAKQKYSLEWFLESSNSAKQSELQAKLSEYYAVKNLEHDEQLDVTGKSEGVDKHQPVLVQAKETKSSLVGNENQESSRISQSSYNDANHSIDNKVANYNTDGNDPRSYKVKSNEQIVQPYFQIQATVQAQPNVNENVTQAPVKPKPQTKPKLQTKLQAHLQPIATVQPLSVQVETVLQPVSAVKTDITDCSKAEDLLHPEAQSQTQGLIGSGDKSNLQVNPESCTQTKQTYPKSNNQKKPNKPNNTGKQQEAIYNEHLKKGASAEPPGCYLQVTRTDRWQDGKIAYGGFQENCGLPGQTWYASHPHYAVTRLSEKEVQLIVENLDYSQSGADKQIQPISQRQGTKDQAVAQRKDSQSTLAPIVVVVHMKQFPIVSNLGFIDKRSLAAYIRDISGFRLDGSILEVDFEMTRAEMHRDNYTVYVTCPTKTLANDFVRDVNEVSRHSAVHAKLRADNKCMLFFYNNIS